MLVRSWALVVVSAFGAIALLGPTSGTKGAPASPPLDKSPSHERPLLRDFMGLNVHTVQF
ncbi:MAG: hypothetical protein JWN51_3094, partial [Phycisphaerales bacterium]|nr:hypothetical protein [Phycisphaerales bacterium]